MLVSEVPAFQEYWYPVLYSRDVRPERPMCVRIFGDNYVVWRGTPDASVHAAVDECPHRAARLSMGWIADGNLVCAYHGWKFDAYGKCVDIPQKECSLRIPPRARVKSVLCEEKYGFVWLCVGMPRSNIPTLPEAEDPRYTLIHEFLEVWEVSAPRIVDNSLDVSHVAFVHRETIGDPDHPMLPPFVVKRTEEGLSFDVNYVARNKNKNVTGLSDELVERTTHIELVQPLVFRGVLGFENGLEHVLFKIATPIDDRSSIFVQFVARNDDPSPDRIRDIIAQDRAVTNEDRPILEGVVPDFPIEVNTEIHSRADRMTIEYRRILAELAAESTMVRPDHVWARAF